MSNLTPNQTKAKSWFIITNGFIVTTNNYHMLEGWRMVKVRDIEDVYFGTHVTGVIRFSWYWGWLAEMKVLM